jgi:hypothetical protein
MSFSTSLTSDPAYEAYLFPDPRYTLPSYDLMSKVLTADQLTTYLATDQTWDGASTSAGAITNTFYLY